MAIFGCQKKDEVETKAEAEKPSRVIDVSEVTTVMTVEEINLEERLFTLTYEGMNEIVLEAAEDLTGIEEIKVGDKLKVTYLTSTAMYVTSPDKERPPVSESRMVEVDSKDGKPRKVTVHIIEETSIVEAIDVENRTAVLKGPDGKIRTIEVADEVQNLENVKVGDQVVLQRTVAMAVDISKVEE
jgi:uncharacterized membrane protein (UPF0127 family)